MPGRMCIDLEEPDRSSRRIHASWSLARTSVEFEIFGGGGPPYEAEAQTVSALRPKRARRWD